MRLERDNAIGFFLTIYFWNNLYIFVFFDTFINKIEEREKLKEELVVALKEAKSNLLKKLASAPFMLLRFKEWNLKYYIPGPDPRNRQLGSQERLVSAFIVEPSSPESFLALLADLSAHQGITTNYGFSLTSKLMLSAEWGFIDPMPIHGTHTLDGRQDTGRYFLW